MAVQYRDQGTCDACPPVVSPWGSCLAHLSLTTQCSILISSSLSSYHSLGLYLTTSCLRFLLLAASHRTIPFPLTFWLVERGDPPVHRQGKKRGCEHTARVQVSHLAGCWLAGLLFNETGIQALTYQTGADRAVPGIPGPERSWHINLAPPLRCTLYMYEYRPGAGACTRRGSSNDSPLHTFERPVGL